MTNESPISTIAQIRQLNSWIDLIKRFPNKKPKPYQRDLLHAMKQKGKIRLLKKRVM